MADAQDNRPGEEEEEEEDIDDAVSPLTRTTCGPFVSLSPGIQDDEGCGSLRHPCQSDHA